MMSRYEVVDNLIAEFPRNKYQFLDAYQKLSQFPYSNSVKTYRSFSCDRFWVIACALYVLLSPISILLPTVRAFTDVNAYRFTVIGLGLALAVKLFQYAFTTKRVQFIEQKLAFVTFLAYLASVFYWHDDDLVIQFTNSFCFASYQIVLMLILFSNKVPTVRFWAVIVTISSCVSAILAFAIMFNIMPVPNYRADVEHLFRDARSASVIDSNIGLWGIIASGYIMDTAKHRIKKAAALVGLSLSLFLVLISGFRTLLVVSVIIMGMMFLNINKNRKTASIIVFISIIAFLTLTSIGVLEALPGVERMKTLFQSQGQGYGSILFRVEEFNLEMDLISERPLLGHGWNVSRHYSTKLPNLGEMPLYGHCMYSALPVRVGIPLFILIMTIPLYALRRGISSLLRGNSNPTITAGTLSIISFMVVSITLNMYLMSSCVGILSIFTAYLIRECQFQKYSQKLGSAYRQSWLRGTGHVIK